MNWRQVEAAAQDRWGLATFGLWPMLHLERIGLSYVSRQWDILNHLNDQKSHHTAACSYACMHRFESSLQTLDLICLASDVSPWP